MRMGNKSFLETSAYLKALTWLKTREHFIHSIHQEKLKSYIIHLYGEEIHRKVCELGALRKEKARLLCSLNFLVNCRDEEVIPTFAKIKSPLKSKKVDRILRRTSFALLRERIQDKRRSLDYNARRLMDVHLRLSTILSPLDWEFVDRATSALGESVHKQDTERLKKKLVHRVSTERRLTTSDHQRTVINLTDERIDEGTLSVLRD